MCPLWRTGDLSRVYPASCPTTAGIGSSPPLIIIAGKHSCLPAIIIDCLTDRSQYVWLRGCASEWVVNSTGALLETLHLPFLSISPHFVHLTVLSSAEILRWLYSCGVCQWWTGSWLQRIWSAALWHDVETIISYWKWSRQGLHIPRCSPEQQTGQEMKHRGVLRRYRAESTCWESAGPPMMQVFGSFLCRCL